jgi:hypothetical protein
LLQKRYAIKCFNKRGANGKYYLANDIENANQEVLIKVSKDNNKEEYDMMIMLHTNQSSFIHVPKVYAGGLFKVKDDNE